MLGQERRARIVINLIDLILRTAGSLAQFQKLALETLERAERVGFQAID